MKKYLIIAAVSALFLVGCKDPNAISVISPNVKTGVTEKTVSFLKLPASLELAIYTKQDHFWLRPKAMVILS